MVSTRRQSEGKADLAKDSSPALESVLQDVTSTSSKKRQSPQVADESTRAVTRKRQKKLPLRERDEQHFERHTHISVEIPVKDITQYDTPMWTAVGKTNPGTERSVEKSVLEDQEMDNDYTEESEDGNTPSSAAHDMEEGHIASKQSDVSSKRLNKGKKVKSGPLSEAVSGPKAFKALDTSSASKPKHQRFGSEEPVAEEVRPVEEKEEVEEEEESSDDDDAPEVVATQDAEEKVRESARSATKAAKEQDAILHKKRKQRDKQLKEQAKAENKKRKRGNDAHEGHSAPVASEALDAAREGVSRDGSLLSNPRPIIKKSNIPEFLPPEYLEDDPEEDDSSLPAFNETLSLKSKKIKFTDAKPKDRKVGSTTYRVAEARGTSLLAPRAVNSARSLKEAWLNGQRGARSMNKKVIKGGFLKTKK